MLPNGLFLMTSVMGLLTLPLAHRFSRFYHRRARARGHHLRGPRPPRSLGIRLSPGWFSTSLVLGNYRLPRRYEPYHVLVTGSPGSGKSSLLEGVFPVLRRRDGRTIVFDLGGESWVRHAREGDALLNPLDGRSLSWSPFAEMAHPHDAARLARSLVPQGRGESQEWHHYAQELVGALLERLLREGTGTNGRLVALLSRASDRELRDLLGSSPVGRYFAPGAERMSASIRAIVASHLPALSVLDPEAGREAFSFRRWLAGGEGPRWLFLTVREDQLALLRPLLTTWIDAALAALLALRPDPERRLWLVLDEFDTLGAIPSLLDALTKGRKYGLAVLAGLQSVVQLERRYGREGAHVLLACFATKAFLRSSDIETASYAARQLGSRECLVSESTRSRRSGRSRTERVVKTELVLPSEVGLLPDRRGWLQPPGANRVRRLRIPKPSRRVETREPFLPRVPLPFRSEPSTSEPIASSADPFLVFPNPGDPR